MAALRHNRELPEGAGAIPRADPANYAPVLQRDQRDHPRALAEGHQGRDADGERLRRQARAAAARQRAAEPVLEGEVLEHPDSREAGVLLPEASLVLPAADRAKAVVTALRHAPHDQANRLRGAEGNR